MWTAVYMIEGREEAKKIEQRLGQEGFLVKIKPFSKEGNSILFEILVPEFEAAEAQTVLLDLGY